MESVVPIGLVTSCVQDTVLSLLEAENHRGLVLDAAGEGALMKRAIQLFLSILIQVTLKLSM